MIACVIAGADAKVISPIPGSRRGTWEAAGVKTKAASPMQRHYVGLNRNLGPISGAEGQRK